MSNPIGILGSGGQAREVESACSSQEIAVMFKAVSVEYIESGHSREIDIIHPTDKQKQTPIISAVGSPLLRKQMINIWPGKDYATIVDVTAIVGLNSTIGEGSFIAPGAVITTNVKIGDHVFVNIGATISHDTVLGDYTTISPGVNIAGNVRIGEGSFIGIGAVIKNGVSIASGVVVGAGAVVLGDILEDYSVFAGIPARKIGQNTNWLRDI